MRKQKSIRWFRYTVEDAKAAQAELDEQAERGWELEEVGLFTATFRRAERPRRCWVEPARWKSERKKDWDARSDYLTLCGEAGWELLEEDGGLFYFRAKEGTDPAPLQTDEDVEWADVWKKALADQVWSLSYLAVYWSIWTVGGYIREHPRMWELFLSNISMAMATLVLLWLGMDLFFVVRVLRYRAKCRQVVAEGEPFPVPRRWGARLRGIRPLIEGVLIAVLVLCLMLSVGEGQTNYIDGYSAYTREQNSIAAASFEYCRYDQEEGDLWVERMDCRAGWLAEWICEDFRAAEGDEKRLQREFHRHRPTALRAVELGFDRAWSYSSGEYEGLILRNGNQVLRIEGNQIGLTGAKTLADIRAWLAEGA